MKNKTKPLLETMFSREETAKLLNVSPGTLAVWASKKYGIPFIKMGGAVRYRLSDIKAFLNDNLKLPKDYAKQPYYYNNYGGIMSDAGDRFADSQVSQAFVERGPLIVQQFKAAVINGDELEALHYLDQSNEPHLTAYDLCGIKDDTTNKYFIESASEFMKCLHALPKVAKEFDHILQTFFNTLEMN